MNFMVRRLGFQLRGEVTLHDGSPSYVYEVECPQPSPSREPGADADRRAARAGRRLGRPPGPGGLKIHSVPVSILGGPAAIVGALVGLGSPTASRSDSWWASASR